MKHGSLFSGIGGFDLAADWMGWENVFHCEWNEFGQKVLKYYWPNTISYHDITKTDFSIHRGRIDILTGGFPCQPYSAAGKRLGKEDERHLWPEMLRAIREIQPTWIVGENVLGLVNWNGGMVFEEVQADLEAQGYEVQPYVLPAVSVNAPHRRDRVWFVAYAKGMGRRRRWCKTCNQWQDIIQQSWGEGFGSCRTSPNTDCDRNTQQRKGCESKGESDNIEKQGGWGQYSKQSNELHGFSQSSPDTDCDRNSEKARPNKGVEGKKSSIDEQGIRGQQSTSGDIGHVGLLRSSPDTDCDELHRSDCQHEVNASERGFDALGNPIESIGDGDASDTKSRGTGGLRNQSEKARTRESNQPFGSICGVSHTDFTYTDGFGLWRQGDRFGKSGFINQKSKIGNWDNFPTVSPIHTRDDGLSDRSHTVTISETRNRMDRNLVTELCLNEGRLEVDFQTGKIFSLKQRGKEGQRIELHGSDCNGYIVHGIRYNGFKIQLRAHQIVWIAANGVYDKSIFMIDHINRNKKDNRLENLRLVDAKGNRDNATEYNGKLSDDQKDMITWLNKEDGIPMREIAEDFGISKSRVHQIISEHSGLYGITFSKWRNESIKAAGNAVVPQVVYQIFKAIESYERTNTNQRTNH